jgi:hypothetical protein
MTTSMVIPGLGVITLYEVAFFTHRRARGGPAGPWSTSIPAAAKRSTSYTPLLADTTEFGRMPALEAAELETMSYRMKIRPVSPLRVEAAVQAELYAFFAEKGTTRGLANEILTRAEPGSRPRPQRLSARRPSPNASLRGLGRAGRASRSGVEDADRKFSSAIGPTPPPG